MIKFQIPAQVCDECGEVWLDNSTLEWFDQAAELTPEEEAIVRKAEESIRRGELVDWEDLKKSLNL